jgi:putative addiction module component (TIGR02574 family)
MTKEVKKLLNDALNLSESERALLAASLIDSLDPGEGPTMEAAWETEIAKRISELDSGSIKSVPWSEARKLILKNLE